jgi:hypothetical protein
MVLLVFAIPGRFQWRRWKGARLRVAMAVCMNLCESFVKRIGKGRGRRKGKVVGRRKGMEMFWRRVG